MSTKKFKTEQPGTLQSIVCSYSPFPQTLKAGKKYKIYAKYKDFIAIVDETKELTVYNKCYFQSANDAPRGGKTGAFIKITTKIK